MLNDARHNRRQSERGQTLIMALAFIAFFGVVVVAVLRVGEATGLQQTHTQDTAGTNATTEAGAALAAADAGRTDVAVTCAPGNTGTITMVGGDTAAYKVNRCNPGLTGTGGSGSTAGANCILCVLNINGNGGAPSAATTVVSLQCANAHGGGCSTDLSTSGGDVYINGSIGSGSITATPSGAHIAVLSGATTSGCLCSPAPINYSPAIGDPLTDGAPVDPVTHAPLVNRPLGCPSSAWSAANGCTMTFNNGTGTVNPGLWSSLSIQNANVTMTSGVYIFTGGLSLSGSANLTAVGVTLYLTCPNYGPNGTACVPGTSGGNLSLAGQGSANISAPGSAQYAGDNVSILADPGLVDPNYGQCVGHGQNCTLMSGGQGNGISGTVDVRAGGTSLQGNAGASINGRLITNSLNMQVSGNVGSGFSLSGTIPGVNTSSCAVLDVSVSGGASAHTGRAVVQSRCGNGALSGVVDFDYSP